MIPLVSGKEGAKGKSDYDYWEEVINDDNTDWADFFTGKYRKNKSSKSKLAKTLTGEAQDNEQQ